MSFNLLSKSKYLNGLQCPKYLWIALNDPERIPAPDAATQHIFDQGHLVGELAKKLFPKGINIPSENFMGNIDMTKELLQKRVPLFEAGLKSWPIYSRVDVLNPVNENEWDIIEVKSSTSVKDINLDDVSFQKLVCEQNGLKIRNCYLAHINNQYVKNGDIVPEEFFTIEDISEEVLDAGRGIASRVKKMMEVIGSIVCPEIDIGPHCNDPYECPLKATECWTDLPEHNVFTLYYGGKKRQQLYENGVLEISEIPDDFNLNEKQSIQCACVVSGNPFINPTNITGFLASLEYPLHYLDFETINPGVPLFDGTRPYQNIPFQFSLHKQPAPGADTQHYWHLAEGQQDPRPELMVNLHKYIGDKGSILVYNRSFEEGVLKNNGETFPMYGEWAESVIGRLVDLMVPFRSFHYYHPAQMGSVSLKAVLPAITGHGYEGLAISDGGEASLRYLDITYGRVPEEERLRTRQDLLTYCGLDTEGMVSIIKRLQEIAI
jgi:hypothetical protein